MYIHMHTHTHTHTHTHLGVYDLDGITLFVVRELNG
jgi:hypothetical protein